MALAPISDNERRWLQTIRHAEGTAGVDGYGTTFGYGKFDPSKGHPRRVVRSGGYASDAAGAYQFLSTTWDRAARGAGVDPGSMTPDNQDRAALYLIRQRGVDPTQPISREAVAKLAPEWASLPTLKGNSYYGQPVKGYDSLAKVYGGQLSNPGNTTPAPAAPAPTAPLTAGIGTGTSMPPMLPSMLMGNSFFADDRPTTPLAPLPQAPAANPMAFAQSLMDPQSDAPPIQISRRRINGPAGSGQRMAGSPGGNYFAQLQALTQPPVA